MIKVTIKKAPLKKFADYSTSRVGATTLNADTFVGVDNLLQNKTGKTPAEYVPTAGSVTKYNKGDTLIGNIRPYLKKIWYANNSGGSSADVLTIHAKDGVDSKYVYYNLFQNGFFDFVMAAPKGTQMPRGDKNRVLDYPIPDFKFEDQQKIASVLSTLDDKIELNNKINADLEQMAKTLYDYWFVQFDFPDANSKPYKSSGGVMVYNEEIKREIPKDWVVKELDAIISKSGTGLNPRDNFELGHGDNFYITIKNVKGGKIIFDDTCDRVDDEALKIINKRSDLQVGDILFTSIEPVGVTYFIHEKPKNWNINESVFTIRADYEKVTAEYLYMLLSGSEMKAFTSNASAGSIHKGIRHNVLKTFKLPYKDKGITEQFSEIVNPILKRIYILDNENQKLVELRDWLLPMLMNGQITVK